MKVIPASPIEPFDLRGWLTLVLLSLLSEKRHYVSELVEEIPRRRMASSQLPNRQYHLR